MSDNRNNPASAPIDWAERLKESLAQDTDEVSVEPTHVDDDLAALLRAQLHHGLETSTAREATEETSSAPVTADFIDTPPASSEEEVAPPTIDEAVSDCATVDLISDSSERNESPTVFTRPHVTDARINPSISNEREEHSDTDSRLTELGERNAALLDEQEPDEGLDRVMDTNAATNESTLSTDGDTRTEPVVVSTTSSPRPAEVRDADPFAADTTAEDEVFHAPLQTDFARMDERSPREDGKKTPRVSRMFGVYRIAEAPVSGRVVSSDETVDRPTREQDREQDIHDASPATSVRSTQAYEPSAPVTESPATTIDNPTDTSRTAPTSHRLETPAVKARHEYTDPTQTESILAAYRRSMNRQPMLFLLALSAAVLGLLFDLLPLLGSESAALSDFSASVFYPLVEIALIVVVCVPFYTRLCRGLFSLFDFEPTRYALAVMALIVSLLHALTACFAPLGTGTMPLFGGIALIVLAMSSFSECMATIGERMAFSVVAQSSQTFVLTDEDTPASQTYVETIPDTKLRSRHVLTGVRIGRVSDYFARTARYNAYMGRLNYILPVALLAAIGVAGIAVIRGGHPYYDGIRLFTATYLACLPCGYLLAMSLPLLIANYKLSNQGGAIIGTAAPTDYVTHRPTIVILSEGALIRSDRKKESTLRDDPHAETYAALTSHLLCLLSMPGASPTPLPEGWQIEICERGEDYLRVYLVVNGLHEMRTKGAPTDVPSFAVEVLLGSHDALLHRGVRLPKRIMEGTYLDTPDERVLYLAFDRRFRRLIAATYAHDAAVDAADKLAQHKDALALVSYDPLRRTAPSTPITWLHPSTIEPYRTTHTGALVTTRSEADLIDVYLMAGRMKSVYRLAHVLSWLSLVGVTATILLSILMGVDAFVTTNTVILCQLLGIIVMSCVNAVLFRPIPDRIRDTKKTTSSPASASEADDKHSGVEARTSEESSSSVLSDESTTTIT